MTLIYIWLSILTVLIIFILLVLIGIANQHKLFQSVFENLNNLWTEQGNINKEIGTTIKAMSNNLTAINNVLIGDKPKN
jgi:predicted PurR-regulated permease PerM